ncbi:MAG: NUDIX domain-containing protein [Candidatus Parcubacteria bacterium]|nr:NUDIX domain-containing protein [Candidatus Parcubacteria bacterium]
MKIPIVNEKDEIIGYEDRDKRDPKAICRITALWLTDSDGNILFAQRAFNKKMSPGLWGPAVAGTVEEGETYESNIIKEAKEEIGLVGFKPILGPKIRRSTNHEAFAQWFTTVVDHDYPFIKQDEEVANLKWFYRDEFLKLLEEKPEMFLADFKRYKGVLF